VDLRHAARAGFVIAAWLFVVCAVVQVFLAGLGVFAGAQNFATHREFGYLFGWLTIVMLVLAFVGRLPRRLIVASGMLIVLFALQSAFIAAWRSGMPALAALHVVNALAIVGLSATLARRSRAFALPPVGTAVTRVETDEPTVAEAR
jgi:mercuric ion transport protein